MAPHLMYMLINGGNMAKTKLESKSAGIEDLAKQLGIKEENLAQGLKVDKEKTEEAIKKAAKFMGLI